uniref:Alternative protein PTPRS n=1 Tax=Homo sapiens TaxID=9606 RepID=L8EAN4_HUMAN|nr:alternative protein PTPRS [Homo sapiens]
MDASNSCDQEPCRLKAVRKPTRANMSVWPPTAPACATPHLPTSTCESFEKSAAWPRASPSCP